MARIKEWTGQTDRYGFSQAASMFGGQRPDYIFYEDIGGNFTAGLDTNRWPGGCHTEGEGRGIMRANAPWWQKPWWQKHHHLTMTDVNHVPPPLLSSLATDLTAKLQSPLEGNA